jgi:RNA polymerase sigma factor (sigma-70 family)
MASIAMAGHVVFGSNPLPRASLRDRLSAARRRRLSRPAARLIIRPAMRLPWTSARSARSTSSAGQSTAIADDDHALIQRVVAGDRAAFEALYHRYAARLFAYINRIVRRPDLAEEALDDTLLVVWQNAAKFDGSSRLSTWLFGIAHNKALKALTRSPRADETPITPAHADDTEGPDDVTLRRDLGAVVARTLDALSPEQRAVVELAFYHERSYQEIAEITGAPVNTVKTRMFHARRRLAPLLRAVGLGWPTAGPPAGLESA